MTCKDSYVMRSCLLVLSLVLMMSLTACSNDDKDIHNVSVSSPAVAADSDDESPLQLVWLTVDYWAEDKMTGERLKAANARIRELGYDFEVSFQGISDETYETYQKGIEEVKKNKQGDLMWTGLGDGDAPEKEGTYYRQIQLGNLKPLDKWMKTDLGRTLKDQYSPLEWKRVTYKNHIYGVRNMKEQGVFTCLILTGDQINSSGLNGKTDLSVRELYQWLEEYRKNPEHKFYLDWNYMNDYNTSFSELGYIKLCDGIYMTPEGTVENVWENEDICQLWMCFTNMKKAGQLVCDDSDGLDQTYQGKYTAALINMTGENMDGSYLYQPDGAKVPVESHTVAVPFLNKIENDVHGVTSWSEYPDEAMQLLTLVNTDKELANLLYFGLEGKDYQLKDGVAYTEKFPDTYCPANPKITYFNQYEANGSGEKEAYYKKVNERYQLSPADGFVPNLKKAGARDELLKEVESFYKTLLEGNDDPKKSIQKFQKKLKNQKYESVLKKVQRQYDNWKKRRAKSEG